MWPLTLSCGWQPPLHHKLLPRNVWYLLSCTTDHCPGLQHDAKWVVEHLVSWAILLFYLQSLLSVCWPWSTSQPGMDWARPFGRRGASTAFRQSGIVSADPSHDGHLTQRRPGPTWSSDTWGAEILSCLSVDWVYLMRAKRPGSQLPFSPRCLSAGPTCFLAADAGFSWPVARVHSGL